MGVLEVLLTLSLFYGGGFFHGYISKEDRIAKTINLQIPKHLKEEYRQPNCFEDIGTSCDKIIPRPRYIVSEEAQYNDTRHSKKQTLYLNECQDLTDAYNKNKYIED